MRKQRVNLMMEPEIIEAVDRLAARAGVTRSDIIRNMVRESIPNYRRTVTLLESPILGRLVAEMARLGVEGDEEQQMITEVIEHFRDQRSDQRKFKGRESTA